MIKKKIQNLNWNKTHNLPDTGTTELWVTHMVSRSELAVDGWVGGWIDRLRLYHNIIFNFVDFLRQFLNY